MSLDDKLDNSIRNKITRYALEYNTFPIGSMGRRSIDDEAFKYINELPKEHLRQGYVRFYYEQRNLVDEITKKAWGE